MKRTAFLPAALLSTFLPAQPAPVHHWPLDEDTGVQAQDIAGGSHGTLQNGVTLQPYAGYFGGACQFDGADDRVDLGPCDITTGTGGFSISLWMKAGLMTGTEQILMAKTTGPNVDDYVWSLSQVNSTAIQFRLQAAGSVTELATTGSSLFSGAWYHLAAVYDGNMMRIYINGALSAFTPKSGGMPWAPMSPASMGDRLDGNASFLGHLDDVRLYDVGLSETDITDIILADVATSIDGAGEIMLDEHGDAVLPAGEWERIQLLDVQGRITYERNGVGRNARTLPEVPPGFHLVCLHGPRGVIVRPFVKP